MINLDAYININFWQLFTVLLATTLLQEFIIKPGVNFLKKYYKKGRAHLEKINGDK